MKIQIYLENDKRHEYRQVELMASSLMCHLKVFLQS